MLSKYLLFAFLNLIFGMAVKGQDEAKYCDNPIVESEKTVDLKFIHENYKSGWNAQFGNSVFSKWATATLQGKDAPPAEADSLNICLRHSFDMFDGHHMFGYMYGFGDRKAEWNCTDSNHIYNCHFYTPEGGERSTAKIYLVYFDRNEGHNTHGLALCFSDGTVGWQVSSISKTMTDEETTVILDRYKSVGFDTGTRVPFRSENCA